MTGTFGRASAVSFNGNKIITSGGGGALILKKEQDFLYAKHLISNAKVPHKYEFYHDKVGFNYRMPSLNVALLFAQIRIFTRILKEK